VRDDDAAVQAANSALYDAFEAADLDLMSALWLDDSSGVDVVCVHPGWAPIHGRAAVLRSWAMIMANTSYIQFVLTDVNVAVQGDIGVVTCDENMLTGMPNGPEPDPAETPCLTGGHLAATNIFRRTPTGWRLWVHHASPVMSVEAVE
jgi:ketosteroid isomerase-like protein